MNHVADEQPKLSVVLISRNQVWNIRRLIASVKRAIPATDTQILLVDSASSDATAETALQEGVTVVKLSDDQHLSPATGRYVGYEMTTGKFVLFLDGDAELASGWLQLALSLIKTRDVAAVSGTRITVPLHTREANKPPLPPLSGDVVEVKRTGGSSLYARAALEDVGQFDPYLFSEEEPELALRLRSHGYRLMRTAYPIIYDYTDPPDDVRTVMARRQRHLYIGTGQVVRKHWGKPALPLYLRDRWALFTSLAVAGGWSVAFLVAFVSGSISFLATLVVPPVLAVGLLLMRSGPRVALLKATRWFCHAEGTLRGLFLKPRSAMLDDFTYETLK